MKLRTILAPAVALAMTASIGLAANPASAAYADCPNNYHCWFSGSGGVGTKWQVAGNNTNLTAYGIATQSGYNRRIDGQTNCGYYGQSYGGGTATKTNSSVKHSYSARAIKSNRFVPYGASC